MRTVALILALAAQALPEPVVPPPKVAWPVTVIQGLCVASSSHALLVTDPSGAYLLMITGQPTFASGVRDISADGRVLSMQFRGMEGGAAAQLDSAALGALLHSEQLAVNWPEVSFTQDISGASRAVNDLQPCVQGLVAQRDAAAQAAEESRAAQARADQAVAEKEATRQRRAQAWRNFGMALGRAGAAMSSASPSYTQSNPGAQACMKTGEQISGFNRLCSYNCMGSANVKVVSSAELCPLTMN